MNKKGADQRRGTVQQQPTAFEMQDQGRSASITKKAMIKDRQLKVDAAKVQLEGFLFKKGSYLYKYRNNKKYFYLEEHMLKFGKKVGRPTNALDLRVGDVEVSVDPKYKTQFKIILLSSKTKIKLKGENEQDRDKWVEALRKAIDLYGGQTPEGGSSLKSPFPRGGPQSNGKLGLYKQKSITLNQISEQLLKYKEQLDDRVAAQEQAFKDFKTEIEQLEAELT